MKPLTHARLASWRVASRGCTSRSSHATRPSDSTTSNTPGGAQPEHRPRLQATRNDDSGQPPARRKREPAPPAGQHERPPARRTTKARAVETPSARSKRGRPRPPPGQRRPREPARSPRFRCMITIGPARSEPPSGLVRWGVGPWVGGCSRRRDWGGKRACRFSPPPPDPLGQPEWRVSPTYSTTATRPARAQRFGQGAKSSRADR